jgi:hypothetical protein
MNEKQAAMFAAMSAAATAGSDATAAMVLASEMSALAANGMPQVAPSPFDVLTLDQVSDYLQATAQTVRNEAENGDLIGRLVDGDWRFVREDVIRWLRAKPGPVLRSATTWTPEREAEAEAEIAAHYAQRRALGTVGDLQTEGVVE